MCFIEKKKKKTTKLYPKMLGNFSIGRNSDQGPRMKSD